MERNSIRPDKYDVWAFRFWLNSHAELLRLILEGSEILPHFPFLMEDLFRYLYKAAPEFFENEEIEETHRFQKQVLEALFKLFDFKQIRAQTKLSEETSIEATRAIGRMILDLLTNFPQEGEGEGEGEGEISNENLRRLLRALRGALKERGGQYLKKFLEYGLAEEEQEKTGPGLGPQAGDDPGEFSFVDDPEGFREALKRLSFLHKYALGFQRLHATRFFRRLKKKTQDIEEIYGIKKGRDLEGLMPWEKIRLSHPTLRHLFSFDFLRGEVLSYELIKKEFLSKGPKIFLIDFSSSTHEDYGRRQGLEKLLVLAIHSFSKRGQKSRVLFFMGRAEIEKYKILDLSNPPTPEQWLDLASRFGEGGTDFERPLRAAVGAIRDEKDFRSADVYLLTDGEDRISPEFAIWFKEEKGKLGFSVVTILMDWLAGKVETAEVAKVSDVVLYVSQLFTQDELGELGELLKVKPGTKTRPRPPRLL